MIVEMEIATGTETGVTYDAAPFGSGGSAGGLFIQGGLVPDFKTLGALSRMKLSLVWNSAKMALQQLAQHLTT